MLCICITRLRHKYAMSNNRYHIVVGRLTCYLYGEVKRDCNNEVLNMILYDDAFYLVGNVHHYQVVLALLSVCNQPIWKCLLLSRALSSLWYFSIWYVYLSSCKYIQLVYEQHQISFITFSRFLFLDYCLNATILLTIVRLVVVTCKVVARLVGLPLPSLLT